MQFKLLRFTSVTGGNESKQTKYLQYIIDFGDKWSRSIWCIFILEPRGMYSYFYMPKHTILHHIPNKLFLFLCGCIFACMFIRPDHHMQFELLRFTPVMGEDDSKQSKYMQYVFTFGDEKRQPLQRTSILETKGKYSYLCVPKYTVPHLYGTIYQ